MVNLGWTLGCFCACSLQPLSSHVTSSLTYHNQAFIPLQHTQTNRKQAYISKGLHQSMTDELAFEFIYLYPVSEATNCPQFKYKSCHEPESIMHNQTQRATSLSWSTTEFLFPLCSEVGFSPPSKRRVMFLWSLLCCFLTWIMWLAGLWVWHVPLHR